jgi:hypothetical protein
MGFDMDLIDLRALSGWEHYRDELLRRRPDVVAMTMMSVDYNPATEAAASSRETLPEADHRGRWAPPDHHGRKRWPRSPSFDYVITREGEITFPWLLGELQAGRPPRAAS